MDIKNKIKNVLNKIPVINNIFNWGRDVTRPFRAWWFEVLPLHREYISHPRSVFLVLTPEHGNLGDHAIAEAIKKMLAVADVHVIELTSPKLTRLRELGWLKIMNGKRIFINGGGNLGTLWFNVEQLQRDIIAANPQSTIFIMPNTIYYENTSWGQEEQANSKQIYNMHNQLFLCARERISFDCMSQLYKNVMLVPDMVLSQNQTKPVTYREGCLLCLRHDSERTRTENEEIAVLEQVRAFFPSDIHFMDMNVNRRITLEQRDRELTEKFDEFRSAKLVITDRLHGMIFAAITGTPCIVINSKSPKVKGTYEWIKYLPYIRYAESVKDVGRYLPELLAMENCQYDNTPLKPYFDRLADVIREYVKD